LFKISKKECVTEKAILFEKLHFKSPQLKWRDLPGIIVKQPLLYRDPNRIQAKRSEPTMVGWVNQQ